MNIPNIRPVHMKARRHRDISGSLQQTPQVLGGSCSLQPQGLNPRIQYYVMQHLERIPDFFPLPILMGPGKFFHRVFYPTRSFLNA